MNLFGVTSGLRVLPLVGARRLLISHLAAAAAFRRRTNAIVGRVEGTIAADLPTPRVPAIVQSFAQRAIGGSPVPATVWLRQSGEMRFNSGKPWHPFTRAAGRRIVPTRWQGRCGDYREMNGCRIPTRGVLSWLLDNGPFEYWRGRVTAFGMN